MNIGFDCGPGFKLAAIGLTLLGLTGSGWSQSNEPGLDYLKGLLNVTPEGGWVRASTDLSRFSSAWVSGAAAVPNNGYSNPGSIVRAWSSFAWDSNSDSLLLWGGGHANYSGNEMYIWQGSSATWTRGSVASRVEQISASAAVSIPGADLDGRTHLIVDSAAPQSAHTYDNNIFLPVNNMFLTFGGATFNSGSGFQVWNTNMTALTSAGPWLWDPTRANPNLVGGTDGSGYAAGMLGGDMWFNRQGQTLNSQPNGFVEGATAYREENGKDVVYLTAQSSSSGWRDLYRYTVGDVRNGGLDKWERIGFSVGTPLSQGAASIDTRHDLFVSTAAYGTRTTDLGVWDLRANASGTLVHPNSIGVELFEIDGSAFTMSVNFGIDFDAASGRFLLWDGTGSGTVWSTEARFESDGSLSTKWVVSELASATATAPSGGFVQGVLGKWKYVSELGAFVALNEYDPIYQDAQVWLYKPLAAVPEPDVYALFLAGLGVLILRARRRRSA